MIQKSENGTLLFLYKNEKDGLIIQILVWKKIKVVYEK